MMCHKKYRSSRLPRYFSYPFLMPNSLRRTPRRHFGLLITTTCIALPPFVVRYHNISGRTAKCAAQALFPVRIGVSGTVSTTTSAPLRVEMVMQSEPSAYSLLTPSG